MVAKPGIDLYKRKPGRDRPSPRRPERERMAMLRSSLGRIGRRLWGSSAAGPGILQAPPLPSLYPAMTWILRPGPAAQLTRTFKSPAAAAAACTRRIPNLQVQRIEGMQLAEQKRFFSTQRKEPALRRLDVWLEKTIKPQHMFIYVAVVGLSSFVATTIVYRRLGQSLTMFENFRRGEGSFHDDEGC